MTSTADAPFPQRMSKDILRELPLIHFEGKIVIIRDDSQVDEALKSIRREKILGFDTESKPTFRREDEVRPPALLQLATNETAWLFQLRQLTRIKEVFEILSDLGIEKVGVAPHDDIKGLNRITGFAAKRFIDLGAIASQR